MRCPTCGHVGADRVCQLCGNNMVDDVILEEQTVVCLGLLEDEIPCAAQLTEELRFCSPCDKKEHVEISLNINVHEDDVNGKNGLHNVTDTPIVVLKETDSSGKSLNTNNVANVFVPENVRRVSLCEESKTVGIDKETEHVNNAKRTENITFDQEAKNVNYEIREMEMDNKNGTRNLEIKNEKEDVDNNNERGNVEVGNGKRNESNNNEAGTVENENERENVDTESKTGNIDSGKESGTVDNENKGNDDAENEKGNLDSGNESGNLDRDNGSGTMENENERGNVDTENKIENANNDDERKNVNNNSYTENADNANERRNLDNKNEKGKVENEKKTKNVDNENEAGNENGKMNVGNDNDTETGTVDTDNETGHFDNWNEKRNVRKENEIGTVEYKNTTITFDNENETGNVENDAGAERNKLETGNSDYEYGTKNLVKEKVTVTMDDENKIGEECPTVSNQRDLDSKQAAHQRSTKVKQPVADKKSGGKQGNANKNTAETQNKERSISKRQSNTTAKNERDTDTIEVHFHVLLSTNIKFVPKTDQAVIRFGSQFFGGWDAELILQHVRTHDTGEEELHTSILIPRTLVVGKNVEYKYYIKRFSKTTKGKRRKDIWEDYLIHEKSGPGKNRRLTVPDRFKKSETWNQFDGLVQKTNKEKFMTKLVGKANRIIFGPTQLKSNAVRAMEIFSGQIVDELKRSTDGDSVLQSAALLDSLNYCLWRVYVVDNSCWDSGEKLTKDVAYYVTAPLVERLLNFLSKLADNAEIAFTDRMFATMAVLVVENRLLKTSSLLTETPSHLNQICISLLPSSPATGTSCKEFDFLKQHFLEQIDMVTNLLVRLVKLTAQQNKNPVWLFLMPLIHFLSGACEPFEPVKYDMSHDRDNSAWWGIARLGKNIIAQFKCQNDSWKLPLGEVIERLAPCFPMDYMLPRTIMACLNPMEVNEAIQTGFIPLEVSCSTIIYLIKTSKVTTTQSIYPRSLEMTTIEEQVTFHCMQSLIDALLKDNTSANDQLSEVSMLLQHGMTIEMTKEALKDNKLIPVFASIKLLLYAQSQLIKNQKSKQIEQDSMDLEDISSNVCRYFATLCCHFSLDMDFQMLQWDQALVADDLLCDETTKTAWNNSLLGCLQQQLTKFVKESCWHTKAYVEYYCKNVHKFKSCLQKCMSKIAFEAIDQAYELDFYLFTKVEKERFGCLLCEMLKSSRSKLLQTDVTEENVSLQPCLSWSPLPQFVKIYKSNWKCKQGGIFDEESKVLLTIVISKLEASYHFLREGNITISDLRAIHQQDRVYADLVQTIIADEKNQLSTKTVLQLIEIRMKELDSFKEHTVWMSTMVGLCQCKKNVDLSEVHDVLSRQEDLGTHCLSELCDTADVRNLSNLKDYKPRITAFKVSDELLNALPFIHKCNDSLVFLKMWNNQCANNNDEKCTIEDVFENIWNPVRESWENTCLSIQQGDIKFCDMETLIGSVYRDDYEKIKEELKRLGLNKSQVEERLDQLKQFRELTKCSSGANSLLKISKVYKLSGSFEKIQKIANYDSQDFCMREFDSSLINTCDFLKELTIEKCRCLDVFVKCGNLVNWLRESMSEPGLKELKVFVDLAFMSAGDEPINIACVQYLHSAVTGYAPLIFDLKPTDGYEKLTDYCSTIWKELEANPNLADQLLDTSRRLEWLKQIKETHGSIEVTSLCQAEAINDNGIYQVGSSVQKGNGVFRQLDQEKAVSLTVTDKSDKGNRRKYTCEQLQDLQSRLMLVAGKAVQGNSSVERFTEIFDSVNRLSNVYVKLCQAGCALFSNWTATLFCDTKSDVCVILKFGTGELKGRRNKTEDLQCLIPQLAGFMERCYEEWLKYIKDKRKDYEHLNYFTVDQLVILQKELVKLSLTDEPSHLIYPLLSAVKRNCTKSELMEAMNKAKASLSKECGPDLPLDELSNKSSLEKTLDEDKEGSFIQEMLDNDFSESLARKALAEVGSDNVSEGITWCMEHSDTESEGDESVVNNDMERGDQVAVFDRWSQATESIQKVISSRVASLSKDERSRSCFTCT